MTVSTAPLSGADVEEASCWLDGQLVRTPVVRNTALDRIAGARLWLKAENLQLTGSYKARGAFRAVGRVAVEGSTDGVIAQSTGNHALAVAEAARRYGLAATLVLPVDAAPGKIARANATGAAVILAGTTVDERLAVVEGLHASTGHAVVDAYDNRDVVSGQGSATLELFEEAERQGVGLDAVVVPVGGGGGVAGACLAAEDRTTEVYGVEPAGCDSLRQSLAAGEQVTVDPAPTLADGLRPARVGQLPFEIVRDRIAGVVEVDDDQLADALCLALFHTNLLVEPSAAAALAGALRLAAAHSFTNIGVLLTGGNVEPSVLSRLVAGYDAAASGRISR